MEKVCKAIWSERALLLSHNRVENIIDSEKLSDEKKLELLEGVIEDMKEALHFILSDN